jgi:hypothetical protein
MTITRRHAGTIAFAAALVFACPVIAADVSSGPPSTPEKKTKRLDLRVPDITELYTPEQIRAMLLSTRSDDDLEEVEVKDARLPDTPVVWGGLAAPFWALLHPAQAWRIVAPLPADRIHAADVRPEAQTIQRDPFRP